MDLGEALDVGLVDDRVGVGDRGRGVVAPVEAVADDEAAALEVGWMRDVVVRDNVEYVRHICPDCLRAAQIGAR